MRGDYLILCWNVESDAQTHTARRIEAELLREPHVEIVRATGLIIALESQRVQSLAPGIFVIGDIFCRSGTAGPVPRIDSADAQGFEDFCRTLMEKHWGSYVAVRHDPYGQTRLSIFADPIGSRECLSWSHAGIRLVSGGSSHWLARYLPVGMDFDLEEITTIIQQPSQAAETSPLTGLSTLAAGAVTYFEGSSISARRLWLPRDYCDMDDGPDDPARLAEIVDMCVRAWASLEDRTMLELSGGLDSAIVGASLCHAGKKPVEACTFFSASLAGDERRYSRAVAQRLDLAVREVGLSHESIEAALVHAGPLGSRPGIGSSTLFHDLPLADIGQKLGAGALFTGRGGDALFFQHPTPLIAAEPWVGGRQRNVRRLEMLASWCQSSIWTVGANAFFPMRRNVGTPTYMGRLRAIRGSARRSTWAGALDGLPPAKQMQLEAIAGDRSAFGASRCAQAMRVFHPLLSQPIIEHVLGLSVTTLTDGRRDRALARTAFCHRLPRAIVERRGKGALADFFGQSIARHLSLIRPLLLEGALSATGLVDRPSLEQALQADYLMQTDCYGEIVRLLIIECWMEGWSQKRQQNLAEAVVRD